MEFGLLGPLYVRTAKGPVSLLGHKKQRVLVTLILAPNQTVPTSRLIDAVWDDGPPATARRQIQNCISALRRDLRIDRDGAGYRIRVAAGQLDATRFADLVDRAKISGMQGDPAEAAALLRSALALWRGRALEGCGGRVIEAAAARLDQERLTAMEQCFELELQLGRHDALVAELAELVAAHPLRERLVGQLMLALHRSGRQAEALETFRRLRCDLADDLGLDPSDGILEFHGAILRHEDVAPAAVAQSQRVVPRQLPTVTRTFVGRGVQLKQLTELVEEAVADSTVAIATIGGSGGMGKTALALHWAHQMIGRFPDGQLYLNLRGFDPTGSPATPAEAIRNLLEAFQVSPDRVPSTFEAQTSLYRSLIAGRRMLLVLDNARDPDQVRPLLPGSPSCPVLITSRNQLTGLTTAEGALPITLDLLTPHEASDLLGRHLGTERLAAEPAAVHALVTGCAGLPLALAMVAARAAVQPGFPLATLATGLADAHHRLDAIDRLDPDTQLRAVFSWSYEQLSPAAARLFRLVGLHPGSDITAPASASLGDLPLAKARGLLTELIRAHLFTEHGPGRYSVHDLLRAYATEQAHRTDDQDQRHAASRRILDHYLHSAHAAASLFTTHRDPIALAPPLPGVVAERPANTREALDWLRIEQRVLLAAISHAADDFPAHAWQLAWTLASFLDRQGLWREQVMAQSAGAAAAQRLADPPAHARARRALGLAHARLGHHDEARVHLEHALGLYRQQLDPAGQGHTQNDLSWVSEQAGDIAAALGHSEQALALYRQAGHDIGQAIAHNAIGWYSGLLGDHERALRQCRKALHLHEALGHVAGQANAWDSLGHAHHRLGHRVEAISCYQRAVDLYRDIAELHLEADSLAHLGDAHDAAGDPANAHTAWRRALEILTRLRHPDAEAVRAKLHHVDQQPVGFTSDAANPTGGDC